MEKWNNASKSQQAPLRKVSVRDMFTVVCDATFYTSYHTLHNIIQQLLRQFIPFLFECTDEGVLVCRRIVSTSNLPPKASHTFSMGFRSGERAGHTRR
ncbi:hypothetical protein TNCV_3191511 [Trichonephila clavipes]|nr:hypothetical protein TNCV_3191511 [Trichonephila clavipes]